MTAGPAKTLARSRKALLAATPIVALAASSFVPPDHPARAALPISVALRGTIDAMSTGNDQPLVVSGSDAVKQNAAIPLGALPRETLSPFTSVTPARAGYGNALRCLTQAVYYEAANEPASGQLAVAQVVLNRVRHPAYPESVCGVVYEGAQARVCQFSFTCDGSLLRKPMPRQWAQAKRVARQALAGKTEPEVGVATSYHADYVVPRWAFTMGKLGQIGHHIFYRLPGRLGDAREFVEGWSGTEQIPAIDVDRLRARLALRDGGAAMQDIAPARQFVPGLTVTPDITDRHAPSDVGGRLDTTTGFQLAIPDPTQSGANFRSALAGQGAPSPGAAAGKAPALMAAPSGRTAHDPELSLATSAQEVRN